MKPTAFRRIQEVPVSFRTREYLEWQFSHLTSGHAHCHM